MDKFKEIRPIVLGIVKKDNKILVSEGYDKTKNETFYRSIGGGIEFLENSKDALKREFKEELDIDINVGEFLGSRMSKTKGFVIILIIIFFYIRYKYNFK